MTVSTGNLGWATMGLVTFIVGIFVAMDLFVGSATGGRVFFGTEISPERLVIAAAASVPWLGLMGLYRLTHRVRRPDPAPATQDLPDDPPAVANMLTNGFELSRDAVPATVLDLAARGVIDIEEAGNDRFQIRVRSRAEPTPLRPFEQRVLSLLLERSADGVVPTEALTTGPEQQSRSWWKAFRSEVAQHAKSHGLSRDLWSGRVVLAVVLLAIPAIGVAWWAVGDWIGAFWYSFLVGTVVGAAVQGRKQRDTPAGYARAARWLGVRRFLREGAFDDLPPTAVTVWERYLAHAAALGVARASLRAMPMGADDDNRAWSAMGGDWRLVRVRYPWLWPPGWGRAPWVGLLLGIIASGFAVTVLYAINRYGLPLAKEIPAREIAPWARLALLAVAGATVIVLLRSILLAGLSLSDLGARQTRTGTLLRARSFGGSKDAQKRHYVAIDDGRSDRIRAFRLPTRLRWTPVREGKDVTVEFSPRLGYLRTLRLDTQPDSGKSASGS